MDEANNFRRLNLASFMTLKSDLSISSYKPSDFENKYLSPKQDQEIISPHRKLTLSIPRDYPVPFKSHKRLSAHRYSMGTVKISANNLTSCPSCEKYLETIENLKKVQENSEEKYFMTEKHLKQYDNLLQIKDSRLQQDEAHIKANFELLEKEKEKFKIDQIKLESETIEILKQKEDLNAKKLKFNEKLYEFIEKSKELEYFHKLIKEKDKDILRITMENQELKKKLIEQMQINNEQVLKLKLIESKTFADKVLDVEKLQNKLNDKKKEIKVLKTELLRLQIDLEAKEKYIKQESKTLKQALEKIEHDREVVDEEKKQVFIEYESIQELKVILRIQEENLKRERELMQEVYEDKIAEVEVLKQKLSDNLKNIIEEKELLSSETKEKCLVETKIN